MKLKSMKRIHELIKSWQVNRLLWIAFVAALLGSFLLLTSEVREAATGQTEFITKIDDFLLRHASHFRRPWLNAVAVDVTALGSTTIATLVTAVFAVLMLLLRRVDLMAHMIIAASGAGLLSTAMKFFFARERPTMVEKLVKVQGFSYPSGHSLTAATVYLTLAVLACRLLRTFPQKVALFSMASFTVVLIGLSRIYLGVHYPSDVLAGILLGVSWALILGKLSPIVEIRM